MKSILRTVILLTFGLGLIACCSESSCQKYFNIKNNSAKSIYHGLSYSQTDFSLKSIDFVPGANGNTSLKIKSNGNDLARVGSSTMQVYIFDADVIENTPWDTIVKYNMVLKRYQFTESELEQKDWEIIYDGK
jgi:hypothetical protein